MTLNKLHGAVLLAGLIIASSLPPRHMHAKTVSISEIVRDPNRHGPDINEEQLTAALTEGPLAQRQQTWTIADKPLMLGERKGTTNHVYIGSISPSRWYQAAENLLSFWRQDPKNSELTISGKRATYFEPGQNGFLPDMRLSLLSILSSVQQQKSARLSGLVTEAEMTLPETNNLGINELLAQGISDYSHSSNNRIANIKAGAKQVSGVLVSPGETFSFGNHLGDVTAEKGFKPEIVIKAEGLKPELGGGICQVSSTLFRAVMQAGLPITQRRNHAFSVSHYLPPGTDATVYTPYTDLKFLNDTPGHLLIWPHFGDNDKLYFDLYGTYDHRQVTLDQPVVFDRKPDGSLKASWSRHITQNGHRTTEVFKSTYLPPALFKKTETFIKSDNNPSSSTSPVEPVATDPTVAPSLHTTPKTNP